MPKYIVGIDEVGRGPLAGPVTVAAVAMLAKSKYQITNYKQFRNIKDSKKLTPEKRLVWYKILKSDPNLKITVSSVPSRYIDKFGIVPALKKAVAKCIRDLEFVNCNLEILLDGSLHAPIEYKQETIIKGDEKIPIISAASIIAKVTRDRLMVRMGKKYPLYGFENHKGYGTSVHRHLVKAHGLCDIHRRSFCTKII